MCLCRSMEAEGRNEKMEEKTTQQRIEELEREVGELKERNDSLLEREKMQKEAMCRVVAEIANTLKVMRDRLSGPVELLNKAFHDVEVYAIAVDMRANTISQLGGISIIRPTKAVDEAKK